MTEGSACGSGTELVASQKHTDAQIPKSAMQRTSVDSSNLAAVGYNPSRKVLEVEFNSGSVYQYYGVPEHEYRNLMSAGSMIVIAE